MAAYSRRFRLLHLVIADTVGLQSQWRRTLPEARPPVSLSLFNQQDLAV